MIAELRERLRRALHQASGRDVLRLDWLPVLDSDMARWVATWADGHAGSCSLLLTGIASLDPPTARSLATWGRDNSGDATLDLSGLATLDAQTARSLATWGQGIREGCCLRLSGLAALDAQTARSLALWGQRNHHLCALSLRGLASLDPSAAHGLSGWGRGEAGDRVLFLNGLSTLDPQTTRALSGWGQGARGRRGLTLNGLTTLEPRAARCLAAWGRHSRALRSLFMNGLRQLDPDTARCLAAWGRGGEARYRLCLSGLTRPDPEALRALTEWARAGRGQHELRLPGLAGNSPRSEIWQAHAGFYPALPSDPAVEGFEALGRERFCCPNDVEGERSFDLAVYRCAAFARAVGLGPGQRAPDTEFVLLPPPRHDGRFLMGSPEDEEGRQPWEQQHAVRITRRFLLARTVVSQRVYQGLAGKRTFCWPGPLRPANWVTWDDVTAWCAQLGLRLPSEAEWEFACRAGTRTPYSFGRSVGPELVNNPGTTGLVDVGTLPPNAFGLFEMHGNAGEWCQDGFEENYGKCPRDGSAHEQVGWGKRVLRGGGLVLVEHESRSAFRWPLDPRMGHGLFGFRPVRPAGGASQPS